jgi:uncharacterized protein (UPF0333 family)
MTTKVITTKTEEKNTITNITTTTNSSTINNNNSKAYFNFINSINSPATRKTYEFAVKKYMQYYGLQDVDELLLASAATAV